MTTPRINRAGAAAVLLAALTVIPLAGRPTPAHATPGCQTSGPGNGAYQVTVCITDPAEGASLSGDTPVTVVATATGASPGIRRMVFRLDGDYLLTDYQAPYTFLLPSARWLDGGHTLTASASMRDGFSSQEASRAATFDNGVTTPPVNTSSFTIRQGTTPAAGTPFVLAAGGDGASGEASATAVSDLLTAWNPNMFLYLGDVYEKGTPTEFLNWYGTDTSSFGRLRSITNPTIGNHEYENGVAPGYFDYWDNVPHYYSYDAAGWHLIALDSSSEFGETSPGSAQYDWLAADLAASAAPCTIVYFHHPRWNIGPEESHPRLDAIWKLMADAGVDIVLTGHDHSYQRWQPLDRDGQPDPNGMTEIIAGVAGHGVQHFITSDDRVATGIDTTGTFGALRLELNSSGAAFRLGTIAGTTLDSGSIRCRGLAADVTAPSTPAQPTASTAGPQEVDLRWLAPIDDTGVTGYQVVRDGVQIAAIGPDTAFDDTSVSPGARYSYQIRALDAQGNVSAASAPVVVDVPFGQAGIFADDFERGDLSRWTAYTGMAAQTQVVESGLWAARATTTGPAAYAWTQLSAAQSDVYYRIRFNLVSHVGNTYVLKLRTPAGGSLLGVYVSSAGKLAYRNDVAGTAINSTTTVTSGEWHELQIHVRINGTASRTETWFDRSPVPALIRTESLGSTSVGRLQIGDNSGGRTYDVAFDAVLADTTFIADTEPPTVPVGLSSSTTATTVGLSWAPSTDDSAVVGYGVYRDGQHLADVDAGTPSFVDTALIPETTYEYSVDAFDAVGNHSAQSATLSATTLSDTTSPTAPTGLQLQAVQPTEVDVSWTPSTDDVGVVGYNVYRDGVLLDTVESADAVDSTVEPFTTYVYEISAVDESGNESPRSAPLSVTTPDLSPPTVPPDVTATALAASTVRVTWGASTDDSDISGYEISRDGTVIASVGPAAPLRFDDVGRAPSTTYAYAVQAIDLSGNRSGFSAPAAATTPPDTTPPDTPTGVAAQVVNGQVRLSWQTAADDIAVTAYQLLRDGAPLATVPNTAYTDAAVVEQTSYAYCVLAVDAAGNTSAPSPTVSATLPPTFLFADGFESGDMTSWTSAVGVVAQSTLAATGSFAARATTSSAAAWAWRQLPAPVSDVYYRFRFQLVSSSGNTYIGKVRTATGGSVLGVYLNAAGKLSYRNDITATSVTSNAVATSGAWHDLQIHVVINGANGATETWLDGVRVDALSRTENLGSAPIGRVQIGDNSGGRTYDLVVDDVAVDDRLIVA